MSKETKKTCSHDHPIADPTCDCGKYGCASNATPSPKEEKIPKWVNCSHKQHEWRNYFINKKSGALCNFPPEKYCSECEESSKLKSPTPSHQVEKWEEEFDKEYKGQYKDFSGLCCGGDYCTKDCGIINAKGIKSFISHTIQSAVQEEREKFRYSWDIAEGTDEWCVQIWYGNILIDTLNKKSDDAGMVKLSAAQSLLINN